MGTFAIKTIVQVTVTCFVFNFNETFFVGLLANIVYCHVHSSFISNLIQSNVM